MRYIYNYLNAHSWKIINRQLPFYDTVSIEQNHHKQLPNEFENTKHSQRDVKYFNAYVIMINLPKTNLIID